MKKMCSLLLAVMVSAPVSIYALPSNMKEVSSNQCLLHLNEMVVGDSLNPSDFLCSINSDKGMALLAAVLADRPEIKKVKIMNFFVSMKPLADIPSLISLQVYAADFGDVQAFASNRTLKELTVFDSVSDDDLKALAANSSLRRLRVNGFRLGTGVISDEGAIALAQNTTLDSISLNTPNLITNAGMLTLAKNQHLKALGLNHNVLSDKVSQAIAHHSALQKLFVRKIETREGFMAIAGNKHITSFSDRDDLIDDKMAIALSKNPGLTKLDLNLGLITDKGISALSHLPSLNVLILEIDSRKISDDALASLVANRSLRKLSLYNAGWPDSIMGPKTRAALADNTTLETLYLSNFDNGDDIAAALALNPSIREVTLRQIPVGPNGADSFAKSTIPAIILFENPLGIGDAGAIALAGNTFITRLELNGNNLGSEAAKALAKNTSLTHLRLASNHIDDEGAMAFANNQTLKLLNLINNKVSDTSILALQNNPFFASMMVSGPLFPAL